MMQRVTGDVPVAVEQVRARYIQFDDPALAEATLARARAGDDFAFLAQQNSLDRLTGELGGDLGFFAAGSLLVPELEAAAFALQPNEISDVVSATDDTGKTTYYIIQVIERDPARELTADMRLPLLQAAYEAWLEGLRGSAQIERLVE
jgi:parvulin-like peptidyl-prolyl isomerase